jgi:hypothetical protein
MRKVFLLLLTLFLTLPFAMTASSDVASAMVLQDGQDERRVLNVRTTGGAGECAGRAGAAAALRAHLRAPVAERDAAASASGRTSPRGGLCAAGKSWAKAWARLASIRARASPALPSASSRHNGKIQAIIKEKAWRIQPTLGPPCLLCYLPDFC